MASRARELFTGAALAAALLAAAPAGAGQPLTVPSTRTYSVPMTTIDGRGAVSFHITLGMLVDAQRKPVGLYRGYPSKSAIPLAEVYGLGMLGTSAGVILASEGRVPLLALHGHIGQAIGENLLSLTYLTSLAPRRYASCTIDVSHMAAGQWEITDASGHPIRTFTVISGTFGIKRIAPCPAVQTAT